MPASAAKSPETNVPETSLHAHNKEAAAISEGCGGEQGAESQEMEQRRAAEVVHSWVSESPASAPMSAVRLVISEASVAPMQKSEKHLRSIGSL